MTLFNSPSAFQITVEDYFNVLPAPLESLALPHFHPKQEEIHLDGARFKVLCCGRKFGKTIFLETEICLIALSTPGPYAFCSLTYKALLNSWNNLKSYLAPRTRKINESQHRITLENGSTIDLWSLENPEPIRPNKYQYVAIDEAAAVPKLKYVWEEVISPTLSVYEGGALFGSTPRGKLNYFYDLFCNAQTDPAQWHSWQLPTSANPYIPPGEIENARRRMAPDSFEQEYMAQFTIREGAVFPNWDENENVTLDAEYVEGYDVEWWVDYGYANPTCILMAQERPFRDMPDHICVFNEVYVDHLLNSEILEQAFAESPVPPSRFFYDPSAPLIAAEFSKLRREKGFLCTITKGNNTPKTTAAMRQTIGDASGVRLLRVHPRCSNLIVQIPSYHYNPNSVITQAGDPKVVKEDDHACFVAGTLITTNKGQVPIEQIKVGDLVLTRKGFYPVVKHAMTQERAQVMTALFSNGQMLTGTPDHPIWIEGQGFARLDTLRYGIMVTSLDHEVLSCQKSKQLNIKASLIAAIPMHLHNLFAITTGAPKVTLGRAVIGTCIASFTKITRVIFQTALKSIMPMATRSIMSFPIWCCYPSRNINDGTLHDLPMHKKKRCAAISMKMHALKQMNGIDPHKGAHGIENTPSKWTLANLSLWNWFANIVANLIKGLSIKTVFVPMLARAHGGAWRAWITLPSFVKLAGKPLSAINTNSESASTSTVPVHVLGVVEESNLQAVFALTVDAPIGEYFANGILVSNCDAARYGHTLRIYT